MQRLTLAMFAVSCALLHCGPCPTATAPAAAPVVAAPVQSSSAPVPSSSAPVQSSSAPPVTAGPTPWVAPFGNLVRITGVFVEKAQSYEEQNLVREPFFFELRAVAGKPRATPLRMRYVLHPRSRASANAFVPVPGRMYELEAYESLVEPLLGSPFLGPEDQAQRPDPGFFVHILHVRPVVDAK